MEVVGPELPTAALAGRSEGVATTAIVPALWWVPFTPVVLLVGVLFLSSIAHGFAYFARNIEGTCVVGCGVGLLFMIAAGPSRVLHKHPANPKPLTFSPHMLSLPKNYKHPERGANTVSLDRLTSVYWSLGGRNSAPLLVLSDADGNSLSIFDPWKYSDLQTWSRYICEAAHRNNVVISGMAKSLLSAWSGDPLP